MLPPATRASAPSASACCDSTTTPSFGMGATEALGGADALVGVRGRHPDVGEHDVGLLLADRVEQLAEVTGLDDLVDRGVLGQERDEALTEEHAVLREHHAHAGHACMVGGPGEVRRDFDHNGARRAPCGTGRMAACSPTSSSGPPSGTTRTPSSTTTTRRAVAWSERQPGPGRSSTAGPTSPSSTSGSARLGAGDLLYFADWRGDPDQRLTDDPGSTSQRPFVAAARRGVDVRGLLWRSHWHRLGFSAENRACSASEIDEAGGQCLRDMRVRTRGSHHQKFVVIRHRDDPTRDVAYVGGIDLCHGRRDDIDHDGDPQVIADAAGLRPDARPGTTCRWPSRARRSTTSRRRSASAGRTAPR